VSLAGVLGLFSSKPRHPLTDDGRMALADHLRELRSRLLKVTLFLILGTSIAWFFYPQLFQMILDPYNQARLALGEEVTTAPYIAGVGGALLLRLKLCAIAALVLTSPLWLYQIWAFIVPGLHPHERRWTQLFSVVAGPLFLVGVATAYYVLPKGLTVLIGFTPGTVQSLIEFGEYFSFLTRMLIVFGVAFEIPLFVVLLNLAGVVSGKSLASHRPWIIVGTFVFAAVATPSTDPFSMVMLALPMTLLFLISEVVARTVDRRRAKRASSAGLAGIGDDEISPLASERDPDDVRPLPLDPEDD
jgi:sec-independent protein translocase protein TatC